MKRLIAILSGVALVNLSLLAQGTIAFQNIGPGLNAPIRDISGNLIAAGAPYTIELLAGSTPASVHPFFPGIVTSTWIGSGYFGVGDAEKVLPGFAPGSYPFLQLRMWNNTGGVTTYAGALLLNQAYGPGPVFQLVSGGGLNGLGNPTATPPVPAPPLFGMPTVVVPEPSTISLGVLGFGAMLLRVLLRREYRS